MSEPLTLPPCRVCGGTATGIHYGVNTCEACKVCTVTWIKKSHLSPEIITGGGIQKHEFQQVKDIYLLYICKKDWDSGW